MTEREQFEAWAKNCLSLKLDMQGNYDNFSTLAAWEAWQARAAAPAEPTRSAEWVAEAMRLADEYARMKQDAAIYVHRNERDVAVARAALEEWLNSSSAEPQPCQTSRADPPAG